MNDQTSNGRWQIGVLFVAGLGLLLGLTFMTRRVGFFSSKTPMDIYFSTSQGLQEGNPVYVMGVRKGTIRSTELVPPSRVPGDRSGYRVHVRASLDGSEDELAAALPGSYRILIRSASMLGGSQVSIERAEPEDPGARKLRFPGPNFGTARAGGIEQVSDWFNENRETLTDTVESIRKASRSIATVADRMEKGEGTMGKLLANGELYDTLRNVAENMDRITERIRSGKGVLGRLVQSEEMGGTLETTLDELQNTSTAFREIAERIRNGEGVAGSLVRDEKMAGDLKNTLENIRRASENIRSISENLNTGKGTLGKLITEERIGKDIEEITSELKKAARSIRETSEKINQGKGSLGKFVNDETFYTDASSAVKGLSEMTEPARRMKTFVGVKTSYFPETEHFIHKGYLRVHTDENKFLQVGASAFDLSHPETDFRFEDGVKDGDDQLLLTPDVQLGAKFFDGQWTLRGGLIEGRPGVGTDYEFYVPFLDRSLKLTLEGRSAYDDVADNDLDENLDTGVLIRSGVSTSFLRYGRVSAGVSRIGSDPEGFVGIGFEYEDKDIKSFFSLLGLAN